MTGRGVQMTGRGDRGWGLMFGFRQRSLYSWPRRLRYWLGLISNRPARTQRLYVVTINGRRFKRIVLPDSHHAQTIARNLSEFGPTRIYSSLLMVREKELWLEFVEGRQIDHLTPEIVQKLARLFAVIYNRDPRIVPTHRTVFNHAIHTDLKFLNDVGVLPEADYRELDKIADRITPSEVWVGYDCTDAILKNFVICDDGSIRGVDAESLGSGQLIGSGTAKACVRWLGCHRRDFLDALGGHGVPDFESYMPFVELSFLSFWVKSSYLEKKLKFVDRTLFDRFRGY